MTSSSLGMSAGKADVVRLKADKLDQLLRREHGQQVRQPLAKLFEDFLPLCWKRPCPW